MMTATSSQTYSIKQLSNEFEVTPRTLRHYEDEGLLAPTRIGQNRVYSETDRIRLAWILRGRRVGFSLAEIGEMLDLYDLGDNREKQRTVTMNRCKDRIEALKAQRDDINATIEELEGFYRLISSLERDDRTGKWVHATTGEPVASYVP